MIDNVHSIYNAPSVYNQGGGVNLENYVVVQPLEGVIMPDGRIWATENLKLIPYGITQGSVWQMSPPECSAYSGDTSLIEGYGLYYNSASAAFFHTNKDALFPGWDVPTKAEYDTLFNAVSKSYTSLQNAGFNDKKCGGMFVYDGNWENKGAYSMYWSRSSGSGDFRNAAYINSSDPLATSQQWGQTMLPIRLIKDL